MNTWDRCASQDDRVHGEFLTLVFGIPIDRDVVHRILAARYKPKPDSTEPSWLTVLGHAKDNLWSLDLFR